jgi:hypothetical protein
MLVAMRCRSCSMSCCVRASLLIGVPDGVGLPLGAGEGVGEPSSPCCGQLAMHRS